MVRMETGEATHPQICECDNRIQTTVMDYTNGNIHAFSEELLIYWAEIISELLKLPLMCTTVYYFLSHTLCRRGGTWVVSQKLTYDGSKFTQLIPGYDAQLPTVEPC